MPRTKRKSADTLARERAEKRRCENFDVRQNRLSYQRDYQRFKRESQEARNQRLESTGEHARRVRDQESVEGREARLTLVQENVRGVRERETCMARKQRLYTMREHARNVRKQESVEVREQRLALVREYVRGVREKKTCMAREQRLYTMREHAREVRKRESVEPREQRLALVREHVRGVREKETCMAREQRLYTMREHAREVRKRESVEAREQRLALVREHVRSVREKETSMAREQRLHAMREHAREVRKQESVEVREQRLALVREHVRGVRERETSVARKHRLYTMRQHARKVREQKDFSNNSMNKDEMRTQRLYLARGASEVYVDSIVLPQHQIDGIRFLYQQYVKRKPGVILNDPQCYGKRVQTILFISAIRALLQLPVLIICAEGKEQLWMHLFRTWTDMGPEVSIQKGTNMVINPICHISLVQHLNGLERREWSILVVDEHLAAFKVLDSRLRAEYRIWLSSNNMKKRLPSFAFIYMWLYPKEKFVIEDFQATRNTPSALLAKSARLDAFMEDIVIRRRGVTVPLGKCEVAEHPTQVSRKNKDSTGKKIKRSKQTHEYNPEIHSEAPCNDPITQSSKHEEKSKSAVDEDFKVGVENNVQFAMETDTNYSITTEMKLEDVEVDSDKLAIEFHDVAVDGKPAGNGSIVDSNTVDISYKFLNNDDNISPNITIKYDSDTPVPDDEIENDDSQKPSTVDTSYNLSNNDDNSRNITIKYESDMPVPADDIENDVNQNPDDEMDDKIIVFESEDIFASEALSIDNGSDNKVINHDIHVATENSTKIDCKFNEFHNNDVLPNNSELNEVKNEIVNENETDEINCKNNEIVNETVIDADDVNRNKNVIVNKNNVSENDKTEQKLEGVELKVKQMEELAMKKFKGSFLDSMF